MNMNSLKLALSGLMAMATVVSANDEMGPAGFMWPQDRVWSGAMGNTAPCGSVASAGNRTEFPLVNGKLALVAQDGSFDIQLAASHEKDPKSNSDFKTLIHANDFSKLDPGHTCINIPNAPQSARAGDVATLQITYISDFGKPENQTFYACADIVYVEVAEFKTQIPCFNATEPDDGKVGPQSGPDHTKWHSGSDDEEDKKTGSNEGDQSGQSGAPGSTSSANNDNNTNKDSGSNKLSSGAIAGIVIGSAAAVTLILSAGFFSYRRKQQRLNAQRQHRSARGVSWEKEQIDRDSVSKSSV